ncbi:hypothetical protein [Antarctobacter heliothermus]|uniref:hypothetical protein n=1 Tax=Antarctobacter heliothermus TaxID=74033 RepID=UPI0011312408|nr:hypothetical protein [Antarctobacter heliothermus]
MLALLVSENQIRNIPKQDLSVHFAVESGRITSVPTQFFGEDENDYNRINALLPSILRFSENARKALGRSDAYRTLLESLLRYETECSKPFKEINYAILYGYGIELQHTYDSVLSDVDAGETPELSSDQRTPMESLLQLHGPLILASKDGRELITDSERYSRSPREERKFQAAIDELGAKIEQNPDVVAADTASALKSLREIPTDAKQYERWYRLNRGAFRNFVIVAAGASLAATLAAAATTGSPLLIIAGAVASWISLEGIKKSKSYGNLTQEIGCILDSASNVSLQSAGQAASSSLLQIREFVVSNRDLLKRIGGSSKEMEWLEQALDDIEFNTVEIHPIEIEATGVARLDFEGSSVIDVSKDGLESQEVLRPVFAGPITKKALSALDRLCCAKAG